MLLRGGAEAGPGLSGQAGLGVCESSGVGFPERHLPWGPCDLERLSFPEALGCPLALGLFASGAASPVWPAGGFGAVLGADRGLRAVEEAPRGGPGFLQAPSWGGGLPERVSPWIQDPCQGLTTELVGTGPFA